jgi:hypothetical protein
MKMKNYLHLLRLPLPLLTIILMLWANSSFSQVMPPAEEPGFRNMISFQPLYMIVNGLRIDYDRAINKNHWIQAAPVFFLNENQRNTFGNNYKSQQGVGLHLYHRYYPGEGFGRSPFYISYGGMWHFNRMLYNESINNQLSERYTMLNRRGLDVIIGVQSTATHRFVIDIYTGMGIRMVSMKTDAQDPRHFDNAYIMPGYAGTIILGGIRIGFVM